MSGHHHSFMEALMVGEVGKPIIKGSRMVPDPKHGEIRVKVTTVGLNPYDFRVRDWGLYVDGRLPVVLGNDIVGVVDKLGGDIPASCDLKVGDRVFGQTNYLKNTSDQCGLQEYCVLDALHVAKVPALREVDSTSVSDAKFTNGNGSHSSVHPDDAAASLVCNAIAPFWAIFGKDGLNLPFPFASGGSNNGKPHPPTADLAHTAIAIVGAGSNCGKYGVEFAALAGIGTIIAIAGTSNFAQLRDFGATHVIDRNSDDVLNAVRKIVGDDLTYVFDAVNTDHTLGVSLLSDSKRGILACIVPGKVENATVSEKKTKGFQELFVQGQSHNQPALAHEYWKAMPGWIESGGLKPTGCTVLEGLDTEAVNSVLDKYRDNVWPDLQVHVRLA